MKSINFKAFYSKCKTSYLYQAVFVTIGIIVIFLIWLVFSNTDSTGIFPSIGNTFNRLGYLFSNSILYVSIGMTLLRLLIGFLLGLLFALIFGLLAAFNEPIRLILKPMIGLLRTLPTAAIILFLIVLLKPAFSLIIVIFLIMFPILYESVVSGIKSVDKYVTDSIRLEMNVFSFRSIFTVMLPLSKNYLLLGIISSFGLGMKVSIMAEVMIGSSKLNGLGMLLQDFYRDTDMAGVFAVALISVVLATIIDVIVSILRKKFKVN